ncbi:mechanosensitive ion channel family protein [Legionella maioricensis]|uniref:Mechanosensitive ion channel family protein n=1 Tax=Legionella maioricensis TaxID=2896528 RepID=A0A9X2D256_9GAMM|nr:mechanosensitive ion channel family protein [Legionella maioricensis]MCL9685048.1 mechanosensitive ion channel family protein [Legionella maioricensis]MCL9688191.1 mechanosensitive ion channel family protein [Legionella maioricensis]
MELNETIKIIGLIVAIFIPIFLYDQMIKRVVKSSNRKLWFAGGIFIFFSLLLMYSPFPLLASERTLNTATIKIIIQCCWWLSLYLLINQLLEHWLWNTFFLRKGIVVSKILRDLVSCVVFLFIIAAIIHFVFFKSAFGLFTASGVLAIILGYSAQAMLNDVFAGLGLNALKQFSEGDWIKINNALTIGSSLKISDNFTSGPIGMVIDMNWRFVNLLTQDNNYLSIPNSLVTKLQIMNLSKPDPVHGVLLLIPLQDQISPEQFKKIILSAAHQSSKVMREPSPVATLSEIKNEEYLYKLVYYTKEMNENLVNDEILSIVWYQCRRNQIRISSIDLIQPVEILSPAVLEGFLLKTDLFSSLNSNEISLLAANALCHYYGPPEMVLEHGQKNSSLFIIYRGNIDVYISNEIQPENFVATLSDGQYFGEMSLLTGDLCSASMVVKTESTVIEITHSNIKTLFSQKPELIEKMSEIVLARKLLNKNISALKSQNKNKEHATLIDRMVNKVRHFFKHTINE